MSVWSRPHRGRLGAEIVLAFLVGVVAFVLAAIVSTAARSHVPGELLGVCLILVVLAVARTGGVVYAVPVGLMSIEAFDWYFLPPFRPLDWATVFLLAVFILTSVLVAEIAARAGRHASASEEARSVLAGEQAALRHVATLVARQPSPAEVFAAVTEEVGRVLGLDAAQMLVYEGDETATVVAGWDARGGKPPIGTRLSLDGESIADRVFRTRRPARIDDYTHAQGSVAAYARSQGVRAGVGTPIIVEGRVWGVIVAGALQPGPLPAGIESRVAAFTELVATAISNAEARRELEYVAAEQAAVGRVATLVAEAVPPSEIFAAVAMEVAGLFEVPLVGLVRFEPERTMTLIAASGLLAPHIGRCHLLPDDDPSILASVMTTGRPARIDDYSQVGGAGANAFRELGLDVGSAVGVPVIVGGRGWGGLVLALAKGRAPLPADAVERVTAFTELVATAIANAEAREEIRRLAEEQAALRRVATLVAGGTPADEVLSAVATEIGQVLEVDVAYVVHYEDDATATVVATCGDDGSSPVGSNWELEGESAPARVFRSHRSARAGRRLGARSAVAAPIIIDDRLWGAAVASSASAVLPPAAERRIASFAELIATAISNAETRTELRASRARVVAASDETRRRLERDLHDGIQQRLVSLALRARTTATRPLPSNEVQGELSLLADGLAATLDELREISRGIHPAILSEAGLGPALKALARRSAVPIALHLNLDSRVAEPLDVAAYYVASEAVTNAVKHAQASVIELQVDCDDDALTLSVRDDGVGGADPGRGSGLIGLKDRVEALGGRISVASPSGDGTTLRVQLPADASASAAPQSAAR